MSRQRNRDKVVSLALYLTQFGYTTRRLFCGYLGLDYRGQQGFYKKLIEDGLIREIEVSTVRERVLMPTRRFVEFALEHDPRAAHINTLPSRIPLSLVRHTLYMEAALNMLGGEKVEFVADVHLGRFERKRPDLLVEGKKAVEVETVHKNDARTYRGFIDHVLSLRDGEYQEVLYVCTNRNLYNGLVRKFNEPTWPVVRFAEKGRKLVYDGDKRAPIQQETRDKFRFELMEYDL